ncbi:hypothetical protein PVK06_039713 [Gossypium arboreum]|uniref:CCHC-type domain-containing protein n=1 Tax=Gossypium arboreum TaxID=29729 RepID=A0ABR0N3L4_GOSAR|nr:hypothetical protein PVK06_039713 [Gossypium arboreum]
MEEGGGTVREKKDEILLLADELIQLSVKCSLVVPNEKPTLICSIWTKKAYNPESFKVQMKCIGKTKRKFEIQLKPLLGGIFVSIDDKNKSWISFKYEKLLVFCFGCGRIGHSLNDCDELNPAEKNRISDDPPYSLALKAESNQIGNKSLKFNLLSKKMVSQHSYIGVMEVLSGNGKKLNDENTMNWKPQNDLKLGGLMEMFKKREE